MIRSNAKPGSPQVVLSDDDINQISQGILKGLSLSTIAQKLGVSRKTLCTLISNNPKAAKAYGNAREEYLKPHLDWADSVSKKDEEGKLPIIDPVRLKFFEFMMKSRARWTFEDIDAIDQEEKVQIIQPIVFDEVSAKIRAEMFEERLEEFHKRVEDAKKK